MLESSLSQLESLVHELVQHNKTLQSTNAQLGAELARIKDDNDTLQLNLLEHEEQHGQAAARIQALIQQAGLTTQTGATHQ